MGYQRHWPRRLSETYRQVVTQSDWLEFALAFNGSGCLQGYELRRPKLLQSRCSPKLTIAKIGEVGYAVLQGYRRWNPGTMGAVSRRLSNRAQLVQVGYSRLSLALPLYWVAHKYVLHDCGMESPDQCPCSRMLLLLALVTWFTGR